MVGSQASANRMDASPYDGITFTAWGLNRSICSAPGTMEWVESIDAGGCHLWPLTELDELSVPGTTPILDLWNANGRLDRWLNQWREALRVARLTGSPGIMFDPEAYVDFNLVYLSHVATVNGLSLTDLKRRLEEIGGMMQDILAEEFPQAWVVDLFGGQVGWETLTCFWIAKGALDKAKQVGSPIRWYAAGHGSIGYYLPTLAAFAAAIVEGFACNTSYLQRWPNLRCAAPLMLYNGLATVSGAIHDILAAEQPLEFQYVYNFGKVLDLYEENFDLVWIYREPSTGYSDDPVISKPFHDLIRHAKYRPRIKTELNDTGVYDAAAALSMFDSDLMNGRCPRQEELF